MGRYVAVSVCHYTCLRLGALDIDENTQTVHKVLLAAEMPPLSSSRGFRPPYIETVG